MSSGSSPSPDPSVVTLDTPPDPTVVSVETEGPVDVIQVTIPGEQGPPGPEGPPGRDSEGTVDPGDLTLLFENKLV